jgi:flap endonuclease-1
MKKKTLNLDYLKGKTIAVDANNYLYQFLALVRTRYGTPLKDSNGNITSHLAGLLFRSTRLIHDYDMSLVFVFDGSPPKLKMKEIRRRRAQRDKAKREWQKALQKGDYRKAFSKAVMTSRLTKSMVGDAKKLLELLGIPHIQALDEAEAQAAYMAIRKDVWAASSKDYDCLLFGAPKLVRFLTIHGREYLPSKGLTRPLNPELIDLQQLLSFHQITRQQLVDLAILVGSDFNEGIKGVGPKTALKLVKKYGKIESLPDKFSEEVPKYREIREIFLKPKTISEYQLSLTQLNEKELYHFLCDERSFNPKRVDVAVERMKKIYRRRRHTGLERWFKPVKN